MVVFFIDFLSFVRILYISILIGRMINNMLMNIGFVFCYVDVMMRDVDNSVYSVIICDIK